MVFANTQMVGMDFAMPDVCLTPTPAGPVPIPYPNFAMSATAIPTQFKTFFMCMPAHNLMTTKPVSMGDNAGVNMGVASGLVMGPARHILGSFGTFIGGAPATKMLAPHGGNGMSMNIPGISLVPSQFKVMILR